MPEVTVGKKLVKSILHSMTGKYLVYAVQLTSMMILARIFSPETFGIFAVIQVFAVFFALLSEMGFGPALVNESKISNEMRDGIYSFTWLLGIAIAITFYFLSPLISWFYENEIYKYLVVPLAVSILFNTAVIVPISAFHREKKFLSIARFEAIAEIASVIVVLIFVKFIEPIYALSLKPLSSAFVRYILVLLGAKNTEVGVPSFGRDVGQTRKLIAFSKHQASFNFLNYFSRNLDNILVGKYLGPVSLGVYDKAYQLMRYPLMLLTYAMSPAIQPVMKELNNDMVKFEILHNKMIFYISVLGLISGWLFYFLAELIVLILLGEQWGDVIPVIKILSLTIPIQIVMSTSGGFYQASGRADLLLSCGLFSVLTNSIAIIAGVICNNLLLICWFLFISFFINYIQCYMVMAKKLFGKGYLAIIKNLKLSIAGVVILAFIAFLDLGIYA